MNMRCESSLAQGFSDSLSENVESLLSEIMEISLDQVMDEGILKDIPLVSTLVSMFKLGSGIRERHCIKKLCIFLDEFRQGKKRLEEINQRAINLSQNKEQLSKELEYILIILDRYIEYDKSKMLANIYLTYLYGKITWNEFVSFSVIIERILLDDYDKLNIRAAYESKRGSYDEVFRLESMGLIYEDQSKLVASDYMGKRHLAPNSVTKLQNSQRYFKRTIFGEKFVAAINLKLECRYLDIRRQS